MLFRRRGPEFPYRISQAQQTSAPRQNSTIAAYPRRRCSLGTDAGSPRIPIQKVAPDYLSPTTPSTYNPSTPTAGAPSVRCMLVRMGGEKEWRSESGYKKSGISARRLTDLLQGDPVRITTSLSVPDSAPQISPGLPRI
jgi:hypothetical protein